MLFYHGLEPSHSVLSLVPTSDYVFENELFAVFLERKFDLVDKQVFFNNSALIEDDGCLLFIFVLFENVSFVAELVPVVFSVGGYFSNNILINEFVEGLREGLFKVLFSGLDFGV